MATRLTARGDRAFVALLAVGLFGYYLAIEPGSIASYDGRIMAGVGKDLWLHGHLQRLDTVPVPHPYSPYAIAVSALTVPLWGLQLHTNPHGLGWVLLVNPLLTALTAVGLCGIGRERGWSRRTIFFSVAAYGILTMAGAYATDLFAEPGVSLAVVICIYGLLRWRRHGPAGATWLGAGVALALLFRDDSLFLVAPVLLGVALFVPWRDLLRTWRRWLPWIAVPIAAVLAWDGYYNRVRFGSPLGRPYLGPGFTFPFWSGLYRQLLSPGKGFFWYDPLLLVALPGLWLLWRRYRPLAVAVLFLLLARPLFYAGWWDPDGGIAWGPRFLLPDCALLTIPLGEVLDRLGRAARGRAWWARTVAISALSLASAVVTLASVWLTYGQYRRAVYHGLTGRSKVEVAALLSHRLHAVFDTVAGSPLTYNLTHLGAAAPFPLHWFTPSLSPVGVLALAGCVLALGCASFVAALEPLPEESRHA
jgi:hypothetical protein